MNLPGFTAEATIYQTTSYFRGFSVGAGKQPVGTIMPSLSGKQCCTPANDFCVGWCMASCEPIVWFLGQDCNNWCGQICCQCPDTFSQTSCTSGTLGVCQDFVQTLSPTGCTKSLASGLYWCGVFSNGPHFGNCAC